MGMVKILMCFRQIWWKSSLVDRFSRSGTFHIHHRNISLSLTLSLTLTVALTLLSHHTRATYLTPPTVPRMKDVPSVYVKDALPVFARFRW